MSTSETKPNSKEDILRLPYALLADRKKTPSGCAIYFIVDATDAILYVGRSVNVRKRFAGHNHFTEFSGADNARIYWYECALSESVSFEDEYIGRFSPPLNRTSSSFAKDDQLARELATVWQNFYGCDWEETYQSVRASQTEGVG